MTDEIKRAFAPFHGKVNFCEFVVEYFKDPSREPLRVYQEVLAKMDIEPMYSLEYCFLWSLRECLAEILMT